MNQPKFHEYMLPLLQIMENGSTYERNELIELCASKKKITDEQRLEKLESGKPIYANRIGWALTYLKKAGLVDNPKRGSFVITSSGIKLLSSKPQILTLEDLEHFDTFVEFKMSKPSTQEKQAIYSEETPTEIMQGMFKEIKKDVCEQLLAKVREYDPYSFERVVVDLISAMGYGVGEVTKKSGDNGIDGIIYEDVLGLRKIFLQAKRYGENNPVGLKEMKEFIGTLDTEGGKGIFITTSSFTAQALSLPQKSPSKSIVLIDGNKLVEYMYDYNLGVSTETTYAIKKIDNDYFDGLLI